MINTISSIEELNYSIENKPASLIYFSHEKCNVCKVLKPKIQNLLQVDFPKIEMFYCDTVVNPEIAAQNSIFTVPTILVFFDGKEFLRKSRNIGIEELRKDIERPYNLLFEQ
ncbi:MAG: thioredoxin family protein [Bacteroidales bacterium]|jgi:thioredoxin 1|nr:thioredoxin family protein [Bacteroidales bacterium]